MPKRFFVTSPFIILSLFLLFSCASVPDRVSPDWTEAMFFKNAQQAMDENRYDTALFYYEVFLIRYPENYQKVIAAEYERAFINYKKRNYSDARLGYEEIIRKYEESPYAMLYHPRFLYLSELGLKNIDKMKAVNRRLFWRVREKEWAEENGESLIDDGSGDS